MILIENKNTKVKEALHILVLMVRFKTIHWQIYNYIGKNSKSSIAYTLIKIITFFFYFLQKHTVFVLLYITHIFFTNNELLSRFSVNILKKSIFN